MIYRALMELAEREGLLSDTAYEPKPLDYIVTLGPGGAFLGLLVPRQQLPASRKGVAPKERPTVRPIPRRTVRPGTRPPAEFLVDNPTFVFGVDPTGRFSENELARRKEAFLGRIGEAADALPDCSSLRAVREFLRAGIPVEVHTLLTGGSEKERKAVTGALFAFQYQPSGAGMCVHDEAPVKRYFTQAQEVVGPEDRIGQCLVTGKSEQVLTRLHANPKGIPPVAKTKGGVPLTSVNADSFVSYGLRDVGCATTSRTANVAIDIALTRLLDRAYQTPQGTALAKQHVQISPDTVVVYWTRKEAALDFMSMIDDVDPEEVGNLLRSPHKEFTAPIEDMTAFYALVLSGMTGRGAVRSFLETTVRDVSANVERYRAEAEIVRPFKDRAGGYPLQELRRSLVARGDLELLPSPLATQLYLCILDGSPFPRSVLDAAVRRNHAGDVEPGRLAPRCSLLKAYFTRNRKERISVALDTSRTDPPYRLGRLLAAVDKTQQDALGSVNATLVDRYYGAASSTPAAVFPTLLRRYQVHLGKLRREDPGLAVDREELVQEIVSDLVLFPPTLGLENQGLFALGFYHQRQHFIYEKRGGLR